MYSHEPAASSSRRLLSFAIDAALLMVAFFIALLSATAILGTTSFYQTTLTTLNSERNSCYQLEEEAKVYEFSLDSSGQYTTPRELEAIFKDYSYRHILYSYQEDPSVFNNYGVIPSAPGLEAATYENDPLAYFYVHYAVDNNAYQGERHDVVDFGSLAPKAYFYSVFKQNALTPSLWVMDETAFALPRLTSSAAFDLYKYLALDSSYQLGLTTFNYLATSYQSLWNQEVDELIQSSRYQDHYQPYKTAYASCAHAVTYLAFGAYFLAFLLTYLLPELLFKNATSFGRKWLKIRLVGVEGDPLKTSQIVVRLVFQFFLFFGLSFLPGLLLGGSTSGLFYPLIDFGSFGISYSGISLVFLIGILISGIVSFFNAKKRTLTDFMVGSYAIDLRDYEGKEEGERLYQKEESKNESTEVLDSSTFHNEERKS